MIFITVGTQEPFNRLLEIMDYLTKELAIKEEIIAQISNSDFIVKNMKVLGKVSQIEFNLLIDRADLIISHAGMGTIITSLVKDKPIIIFPRKYILNEHRNDHQIATAIKMKECSYVYVAFDKVELTSLIKIYLRDGLKPLHKIGHFASIQLQLAVENFISCN